jgi:hypothetical protein
MDSIKFDTVKGFGWLRFMDMAPGEYEISARQTAGYSPTDVNDFTVNVYSKEQVTIRDR